MRNPSVTYEEFKAVFEQFEREGVADPGILRCIQRLGRGSTAVITRYKHQLKLERSGATLPASDVPITDPIAALVAKLWEAMIDDMEQREAAITEDADHHAALAENALRDARVSLEDARSATAEREARITELEGALATAGGKLSETSNRLTTAERALEERQARLKTLEDLVVSLRKDLQIQGRESADYERGLTERIGRLEEQLREAEKGRQRADAATLAAEDMAARERDARETRHREQIDALRDQRDTAIQQSESANARAGELDRQVAESREIQAQLREKLDAVEKRLHAREDRLDELATELRISEQNRAELQRHIDHQNTRRDELLRKLRAAVSSGAGDAGAKILTIIGGEKL